jgi:hypothetical protein
MGLLAAMGSMVDLFYPQRTSALASLAVASTHFFPHPQTISVNTTRAICGHFGTHVHNSGVLNICGPGKLTPKKTLMEKKNESTIQIN